MKKHEKSESKGFERKEEAAASKFGRGAKGKKGGFGKKESKRSKY